MMNLFTQLAYNPWISFLSLVIGILSLIFGIYYGAKGIQRKKIFVSMLSNELIKNKQSDLDGLSIQYGGKTVENLTVTKLTFWNSSIPTINNSDLIPNAPFTISLKNGIILDVSVLKGDSSSNLIKAIYLNEHTVNLRVKSSIKKITLPYGFMVSLSYHT